MTKDIGYWPLSRGRLEKVRSLGADNDHQQQVSPCRPYIKYFSFTNF